MFGAFLSGKLKAPELALDQAETDQIAAAVANVGKYYDVPVSPVTQAWLGLATTIGGIYYAKVAAMRIARAMEAKA